MARLCPFACVFPVSVSWIINWSNISEERTKKVLSSFAGGWKTKLPRSRGKFVVTAKSLTWSSWGRGGIGLWRWRAAGWMLEGCVDWRDNLKFKARAASVVRSLTECHDGCCGHSRRSCYKASQFLSFSRGIVPRSLLGCCTREFDSSRRHKLGR